MMEILKELPSEFLKLKKPPQKIYYKGNLELLKHKKVAIVGSRRPSFYTKNLTSRLAQGLNERGVVVVSGGAMGVDAIAHRAAFPNTIMVAATSLEDIYPKVNKELISSIYKDGLAISEYAKDEVVQKYFFVDRNRLVIALSEAVIIAQADLKSGSMQSAKIAKKLNKPIYVLPQRLNESDGTNLLLKNGEALLINDIDQFLSNFGKIVTNNDPIIEFCKKESSLEKALAKFGPKIYEYEFMGKLKIKGASVVVCSGSSSI